MSETIYKLIFMDQIKERKNNKLHIFLDLDSTIINSLTPDEIVLCENNGFHPLKHLKFHKYYYKNKLEFYIFERPFLDSFLDHIFENYIVSVFTAAQEDYAKFIVDNIIENKPNRRLKYFFYSYHSDITYNYLRGLKDLNILWNIYGISDVKPCNTIILDDNIEVFETNKLNCIRVPEFSLILEDESSNKTEDEESVQIINPDIVKDDFLKSQVYYKINEKKKIFKDIICPLHFPLGKLDKDAKCKLDIKYL